jgi:hypothetical protein
MKINNEQTLRTIQIEQNALLDAPIWESHKRGKNWCAIIAKDPTAPNGLAREFLERARGQYYYILHEQVVQNTPLEFGADYYSGSGNPHRQRWYGVVISVSDGALVLEQHQTALAAINAAKYASVDPGHIQALEAEAAQLRTRLAAIEQELESLQVPQEVS